VPDDGLRAQALDDARSAGVYGLRGRFVRRQQRPAQPLLESDAQVLARVQLATRLLFVSAGQRPHADVAFGSG
jgi:hypothetical protein